MSFLNLNILWDITAKKFSDNIIMEYPISSFDNAVHELCLRHIDFMGSIECRVVCCYASQKLYLSLAAIDISSLDIHINVLEISFIDIGIE